MKRIIIMTLVTIFLWIIQSCDENFLEKDPIASFGDEILSSEDGIEGLLIGAYDGLAYSYYGIYATPMNCVRGVLGGGEAYKGSDPGDVVQLLEFSQFGVTTNNQRSVWNWEWQWTGVSKCNDVLRILPSAEVTEKRRSEIEAEARFLRGYFYFEAKIHYGNIPWIDENETDLRVPNFDENGDYINIWPQIAEDFDFARNNLPEIQSEVGRPNKWAADCFYSKVLIYRACENEYENGYSEALTILTNVINQGVTMSGAAYNLLPNYHSNFDPGTENGPESVWAVQKTVNDVSGSVNGLREALWWNTQNSDGPGLGHGTGQYQPTEWFVNHFRTDPNGLPFLDMFETNPYQIKDDYGLDAAPKDEPDPFIPDTCGVDPRLDWTVGRRGIPFFDWGYMPGKTWIRNQEHGGPYFLKKFQIFKDKVGIYSDIEKGYVSVNIPVIRFSDVLLLAAECEAKVGSLANARILVNRVRQRMIDNADSPENRVKLEDGITDAANYRIGIYPIGGSNDAFTTRESALNAILYERTLELGFEGSRFFDVVRLGQAVEEFNAFIDYSKKRYDYFSEASFDVSKDELLPIPRDAVDLSLRDGIQTLKQNPGY